MMTAEEAKEKLEVYHDVVIGNDGTTIDIAMNLAIKALEKQIPKFAETKHINESSDTFFANVVGNFCPTCGSILETANFHIHRCKCGQYIR